MVKFWVLGFLLAMQALSAEVSIQASLDNYTVAPNQPFKGTLSITHPKTEKIDPNSFALDGKPLKVTFVQETPISSSSDLIVTFYSFLMPGQAKGLQILSPVSVVVGGKKYQSLATTYEVNENAATSTAVPYFSKSVPPPPTVGSSPVAKNPTDAALKLEGSFGGNPPFYPGQKIVMTYRYAFNTNIELTDESLPLLDAPGFKKIGSRDIKDFEQGGYSIREITQTVVATKPGKFDFPGAVVEGYVYRMDDYGVKQYQKPKLHVETLPLSLTVDPFPDTGRPASFNGAIGPFSSFKASLNSPSSLAIGDKLVIALDLSGTGELDTAPAPDLCCQPGFSGIFQTSDLPPIEKVQGDTKHFEVELRPQTDAIKAVPVIEFSYFDPVAKTYGKLHSEQIPIEVHSDVDSATDKPTANKKAQVPQSVEEENWQKQPPLQPIPKSSWVEEKSEETSLWSDAWWVFLLIPLGALLLLYQKKKKQEIAAAPPVIKPIHSHDLLEKALQLDPKSAEFQKSLTKAFLMRLVEKGGLPSTETTVQKLPTQGKAGLVRAFLLEIEEKRYSGQQDKLDQSYQHRAKELFDSL